LDLLELPLRIEQPGLGGLGPGADLTQALVQVPDACGHPLQEVVDVAGVLAAAPSLPELDSVKRLRGQFHGATE
jgi:hypothetical protein